MLEGAVQPDGVTTAQRWAADLDALHARLAARFRRAEPRRRALAYLRGLLSSVARKNGWQLAEQAGEATPDGMQRLLAAADWDADAVRDDLCAYVIDHLAEPDAVLVVDETGFLKKGDKSAGVQPQYSGAAGRTANAQIGVFLTYAAPRGHTFLDRALYLPGSWTDDRARCRAAGIPDEVAFATKPALAQAMLERALGAGVPAAWVTGDEVYGGDYHLRAALEAREQPYALTVSAKQALWVDWQQHQARTLVAAQPAAAWERLSCGDGSKGPRLYDWLRIPINQPHGEAWQRWLVARRGLTNPDDPRSIAYFLVFAPAQTTLAALAEVIGTRWGIECTFEESKGAVGLDHYEVRSWHGWYRHITLAMWAHAFLTVTRASTLAPDPAIQPLAVGEKWGPHMSSLEAFKWQRGCWSA